MADDVQLGKPLVFEEFGKDNSDGSRDSYYSAAFQAVEASLQSGGPLKGAMFWQASQIE